MFEKNVLFAIPPAHCTAKGAAQLDLKKGFFSRVKKVFRRLLLQQSRASMKRSVAISERARVKYSQVLRLFQMACAEVHSGDQNLKDNERVGYFIDQEGRQNI